MKSRLIAAATAAAIALGSLSATPAAALDRSERTALTLLLGAATVGLILSDNKKRKNNVSRSTVYDPYYYDNTYSGNNGRFRRDDDHDNRFRRGFDDHDNRRFRAIPEHCQRSVRGHDGRREVISARCLSDAGYRRNLPTHCAFDLRDNGRRNTVYGSRCLRQEGFRIGQNR